MATFQTYGRTIETVTQAAEEHRDPHRCQFGSRLWKGLLFVLFMATSSLTAAPIPDSGDHIILEQRVWQATTESYRRAALRTLLDEVNCLAGALQLPEKLPIQPEDLIESAVFPPGWSESSGWFGSIGTPNYHYAASAGNKLCSIERNRISGALGPDYFDSLKRRYAAPKGQMDTNAAYSMATQWLSAAGVDIKALERDSLVQISAWDLGDKFVPLYHVSWKQPHATRRQETDPRDDGFQNAATVEFVQPDRRLLQMRVENAQYLKRKPLTVPDRERLLQQTDDPLLRQMWFVTQAYKEAALDLLLMEVNKLGPALGLPDRFPLRASDLTEVSMGSPFISERLGRFGSVATEDFTYSAAMGNKLSVIGKNFRSQDEGRYLASLKTKYALPKIQINTNAAYMLATQWLSAISVDVKALERDFKIRIKPWDLGNQFVPLYEVAWIKDNNPAEGAAALVEVLEPERVMKSLAVYKAEYIKREPLSVANREKLLSQTNALESKP